MKAIFLLMVMLPGTVRLSYGCECAPMGKFMAKKIAEEAELIIIGHAVRGINFRSEVTDKWNSQMKGFNVVVQIDSVLKGRVNSKELIIVQLSNTNCDRLFEFGERVIISGNVIERSVNITPEPVTSSNDETPSTSMPPPPPSEYNSKYFCNNQEEEEVDFWNQMAKENIMLTTSICSSFLANGRLGEQFLENYRR